MSYSSPADDSHVISLLRFGDAFRHVDSAATFDEEMMTSAIAAYSWQARHCEVSPPPPPRRRPCHSRGS